TPKAAGRCPRRSRPAARAPGCASSARARGPGAPACPLPSPSRCRLSATSRSPPLRARRCPNRAGLPPGRAAPVAQQPHVDQVPVALAGPARVAREALLPEARAPVAAKRRLVEREDDKLEPVQGELVERERDHPVEQPGRDTPSARLGGDREVA